jgi:gliding motility-associated lipoprotein GldH
MRKFLSILAVLILFSSCANDVVFNQYKSISNSKWHKDSIINFVFSPIDTLSKNAIYVNLRNNKNYEFNNLFLIVSVDFPNKTKITDTLEYEMTDKMGYFLGTGLTDIKENKLEYKSNIQFPLKGDYRFSIQQAMRKNGKNNGIIQLEGVSDVGIQIKKITKDDK